MDNQRQQMTDYQKEVNDTVESFWQAAQAKRGRVLGEREVRHIAAYIAGISEGIMELQGALSYTQNMLAAYKEEFGENLLHTLITNQQDVVEGEIVEEEE